jgi:hypothetical protein
MEHNKALHKDSKGLAALAACEFRVKFVDG